MPDTSESRSTQSDRGVERFQNTLLARETAFLTARARGRGNELANQLLKAVDLKVRHFAVLSLACSGTGPSQREMGEFIDLDPSQVVSVVDHLEDRGLIRRETDPRDRRSKILVATEAGNALHDQAARLTRQAEDQVLQNLTSEEREQLLKLLSKIVF